MTTRRLQMTHVLNGGWATDFGPSSEAAPDQGGTVVVPFLVDAENVFYELDGGPHKIGGATKLNSSVIESGEQIRGLFDYWRQGTAGSPTQKRIVHAGTKVLQDDADGTFNNLFTGFEDAKVPCYATFDDLLIISSDSTSDVPSSWDGTTAQSLAGSPPNFAFHVSHKNRLWAAGVVSNPSRLYYSSALDPEDWTADDSGSIDIDPGDGDRITMLASHKNELWVFKGPYRGSIHRIVGSAPTGADPFGRVPFISGVGSAAHNLQFRFKDDLGFVWSDGSVHSLAATAAFGDFEDAELSRPINTYLREHLNADRLPAGWAATHVNRGYVLFTLAMDSSTDNNVILMMDYRRPQMWWAKWPALSAGALASVVDQSKNNVPTIMAGGNDGFVRKLDQPVRSIDGDTAISAKVTLPFLSYGSQMVMKNLAIAGVGIQPKGNYTGTFLWQRDNETQQSQTFSQAGGDVLAPAAAHQFTLGTSTLGGATYLQRYMELEEGGEFRAIQYQLTQTGNNQDLEVHSLVTMISRGALSTEN